MATATKLSSPASVTLARGLLPSLWIRTLDESLLFSALVVTWLVGGLVSGSATSSMKAAVAGSRDPDRVFAFYSVLMLTFGAIAVPLLTQLRLRHRLVFASLALSLLTASLLAIARWWPERSAQPPRPTTQQGAMESLVVRFAAIAALGCYFLGYSGVWPYVERLGIAAGLEPAAAGKAVGLGLASGGVGAALAAMASTRIRRIHGYRSGIGHRNYWVGFSRQR